MLLCFKGIYHLRRLLLILTRYEIIFASIIVIFISILDKTATCGAFQLPSIQRGRIYSFCWSGCTLCSNWLNAGFTPSSIFEFLNDLALHWRQIIGQGLDSRHLGHSITVAACVEDRRTIGAKPVVTRRSRLLHVSLLMPRKCIVDKLLDIIKTVAGMPYLARCPYFGCAWILSLHATAFEQGTLAHIYTECWWCYVCSRAWSNCETQKYIN